MVFHRQARAVAESARYFRSAGHIVAILATLTIAATACSNGSEPAPPIQDPGATPAVSSVEPTVPPADAGGAAPTPPFFSNVVPSVEELLEIGLTREEADCFIDRLDPEETGVFTNAERFTVAMGECFGSVG